ncbi:MAG: PEP-CTERM sorting domain-containing protein [Pseudomonadota bacterium]|nr:PEP-CTERM sorting domain-containing protein [Pseudomonadota bacterium]
MTSFRSVLKPLAFAAVVLAATSAHAALTVYTSAAAFAGATASPGVDSFSDISLSGSTAGPLVRTAGAYGYTASTTTDLFYGAGTSANPWLSTNTNQDTITFDSFGPSIGAIGGNFFTSDVGGSFTTGGITVTVTDSLGATSTQTIASSAVTSFLGFVSTGNIAMLEVTAVPDVPSPWPTVDNLTLALAAPVPEPSTYAMLLAGLASLGFIARRRKNG